MLEKWCKDSVGEGGKGTVIFLLLVSSFLFFYVSKPSLATSPYYLIAYPQNNLKKIKVGLL